jgi:hypothetical protein
MTERHCGSTRFCALEPKARLMSNWTSSLTSKKRLTTDSPGMTGLPRCGRSAIAMRPTEPAICRGPRGDRGTPADAFVPCRAEA